MAREVDRFRRNDKGRCVMSYSGPDGKQIRLPFRIGVVANLSGHGQLEPLAKREFVRIDKANFDEVMRLTNVELQFVVPERLTGDDEMQFAVELKFHKLSDFHPDNLVKQIPVLVELLSHRENANAELARDIDGRLSAQLAEILHHPEFQSLEGSWRALHRLVSRSHTGSEIEILVLNAALNDLQSDVEEVQSSSLSGKLNRWLQMVGGSPFGALVVDYEWSHHPDDLRTLQNLATIGEKAQTCVLSAAAPELLGLSAWKELERFDASSLTARFQEPTYTAWQSFRDTEAARYVTLTCPRMMARLPYGNQSNPTKTFVFDEINGSEEDSFAEPSNVELCWSNSAYALAENILDSYWQTGWFNPLAGEMNGGKVGELPLHNYRSDDGRTRTQCPTEIGLTLEISTGLARLGLTSLTQNLKSNFAVFYESPSLHEPKEFVDSSKSEAAKLAARLPYTLAISRVAHYVLLMFRDDIGAVRTAERLQDQLHHWLTQYVLVDDSPSIEIARQYPFRNAKVDVRENPRRPGGYLVDLALELRLVGDQTVVPVHLAIRLEEHDIRFETSSGRSESTISPNDGDETKERLANVRVEVDEEGSEDGFYRAEISLAPPSPQIPIQAEVSLVSDISEQNASDSADEIQSDDEKLRIDLAELRLQRSKIAQLRSQLSRLETDLEKRLVRILKSSRLS